MRTSKFGLPAFLVALLGVISACSSTEVSDDTEPARSGLGEGSVTRTLLNDEIDTQCHEITRGRDYGQFSNCMMDSIQLGDVPEYLAISWDKATGTVRAMVKANSERWGCVARMDDSRSRSSSAENKSSVSEASSKRTVSSSPSVTVDQPAEDDASFGGDEQVLTAEISNIAGLTELKSVTPVLSREGIYRLNDADGMVRLVKFARDCDDLRAIPAPPRVAVGGNPYVWTLSETDGRPDFVDCGDKIGYFDPDGEGWYGYPIKGGGLMKFVHYRLQNGQWKEIDGDPGPPVYSNTPTRDYPQIRVVDRCDNPSRY